MIITAEELIQDDHGNEQLHRISVRADRFNMCTIEYLKDRATLIVSLDRDTVLLRTHIRNAIQLRALEKKLYSAVNDYLTNNTQSGNN